MKKGDSVYIVPDDTRHEPYYTRVKSVGSKYIIVEGHPSYSRFSVFTHESVSDRDGWNPYLKLYMSVEDYNSKKALTKERNALISDIENVLSRATLGQLKTIHKLLFL